MVTFIRNILMGGSLPQVLGAVAFAGAVASLSSCTIARLPVMLGYVTTTSESKRKGLLLSIAFSFGLIVSYTMIGMLLGVVTHLASKLIQVSQCLYFVLGVFLVFAGMFFAGLIPAGKNWFRERCERAIKQAKSLPSAFILGMFFAFLEMPACPCCGAVLLLIASLVAMKGSLVYSGLVFFSFALGQSLPVLAIGISTGLFKFILPKTDYLEGIISFVVGNILIVSGIFLLTIS